MLYLALRNFFQSRVRLAGSVAGVALALTLVLALDAILAGVERRLTAYVDHSGADVWVAQAGVRSLHMASSALPASAVERVRAVAGVASATPILYVTAPIVVPVGEGRAGGEYLAYVIGLPADAAMDGPWRMAEGAALPGPGEIVIDRDIVTRSGAGLGAMVRVLGRELRVVGLADSTASLTNSVAFVSTPDFRELRGPVAGERAASYILVAAAPGVTSEAMAERLREALPDTRSAQMKPACRIRASRRRWVRFLVLVPAAPLAACGVDDSRLSQEGLPRYAYRSEPALAAYRYAVAQPELLAKLPCYCGCGKLEGFDNLRDCFISAGGAFNAHGANCQTCIDEALDARRLQADGKGTVEIRRTIDATYRGRGTPTNTPPVE